MGRPLRALLVEDSEADAELLVRELRRGGFDVDFVRVDTKSTMADALGAEWDVVLSDFSIPGFGATEALATMQEHGVDLPFLIISGSVNEEIAVEAMRAGAHDFMAKGNLARLVPAIERELRDADARAERARMQEQLLISDRMVSVGTLAAGVAHEINNPLAMAMANIQFAIEDLSKLGADVQQRAASTPDGDGRDLWVTTRLGAISGSLNDALESAQRVRNIVRDLRVFSRADEEATGSVDVHRVLESTIRMAWNEIRHRARLERAFGPVPNVHGNEGRLGQVFLNLLMNAAQAIPEGQSDANSIRLATYTREPGRVTIEVRDTGSGMDDAVIARIFDPFFTTKPIGVGTGLGLAICHRIVTSFGGELEVESAVGKGSVFRVILPTDQGPPAMTSLPPATPTTRRGRILVVDDEAALGTIVRRMLSPDHEVLAVSSARAALDLVARGEQFDLVLCDLMMPDITGMDLHAELTKTAPKIAGSLVFMTGGAFTPRAREFLDRSGRPWIEKPFDVAALRALVHGALR